MSSQNKQQLISNTKKAEEKYNMNVEDLMNEDDDESDDDGVDINDVQLSDDEELDQFYKDYGRSKQTITSNTAQIASKITTNAPSNTANITSSTTTNSLNANKVSSQLAEESKLNNSLKKATAQLIQVQNQNLKTSAQSSYSSAIMASVQSAESSNKYISALENLSDSSDDDDNLILESLLKNRKKKLHGQQSTLSPDKKREIDQVFFNNDSSLSGSIGSSGEAFGLKQGLVKQNSSVKEISKQTDIIEIVEKNEKMNDAYPEKVIEQPSQYLAFDNKFYKVQKKLMVYSDFPMISKKLHEQKDHQYSGIVSSIAMYQNYLFVGNSQGIIRVFDLKSQKEMKPLMDQAQLNANKVSTIEISKCGGFLISGYKKGQIALWDLVKYKLLKIASEFHSSDVINAKFYYIGEDDTICTVSAEDSGAVCLTEFKKQSFLGGYSFQSVYLFKTRLKGPASMALQKKNEMHPCTYTDTTQLIAFGALNEVVICAMRPVKELLQVTKPNFCKEKSLPYCDWGYGLTPSQREKTVPILAFAWDRLIQLIYVKDQDGQVSLEMDGFYYSDQEINSLQFIGDSILFVLVNGKEVKILYTTKFYPGHFRYLENARKDDLLNNQFEKVTNVTLHAEIEKGYEVQDIRGTILQCQSVMNFNQCVKKYKANIFFMGNKSVLQGHLFSWKEYLDHIKYKENYDWLTVLKVALEIYTGEQKGYAKVPDEKDKREKLLKDYMMELIKDSVQNVIYKYNQANSRNIEPPSNSSSGAITDEEKKMSKQPRQISKQSSMNSGNTISQLNDQFSQISDNQADSIAIKVAIEFCLNINASSFLFENIYEIFVESRLDLKFLISLEPFILSGQFRKVIIPENIVRKLVNLYEEKGKLKILEKIIMNLDFKEYSKKEELLLVCQAHCMVSAFLYLMASHSPNEEGCMQILNTMAKLMRNAKNQEYQKEDIYLLQVVDSQKKYDIEKSKSYIGYKLLWIIKMFLEGKMFPSGQLPEEKWRMHVYDIANFLTTDEFQKELINFDPEQFFKIASKLFYGVPYKYLITMEEYNKQKQQQRARAQAMSAGGTMSGGGGGFAILYMKPQEMIKEFEKRCLNKEDKIENFYKFILYVQSQHVEESKENPQINLDYTLVFNSILAMLKKKPVPLDEDVLINSVKAKKIKKEDLETIINQLDQQTQSLTRLRIFIAEKMKNFVQSFKLNLHNSQLKKSIFSWIDANLEKLNLDGEKTQLFEELKVAIKGSMQELISLNVNESLKVIDKWFDEQYQEKLILDELASHQEIQYDFLKRFLKNNEQKIAPIINEAQYSNDKKNEANKYINYLVLFTNLLCIFAKNEVEEYVKKEYYPIQECLEICKNQKVEKGVAVLYKRSGQFLTAIETYLNMIKTIELSTIINELNKIVQQSSSTASGSNVGTGLHKQLTSQDQHYSHKWDFLDCQKYKTLNEFDTLLQKSMKIANKKNNEIGDEGWFVILEFLNEYANSLNEKYDKINQGGTYSSKQLMTEKTNFERLKDFVIRRKNTILKAVPTSISLKVLTERLKLNFSQIKKLYDFKVRALKNDEKYLKLAKTIQIHEVLTISKAYALQKDQGFWYNEQSLCTQCSKQLNKQNQKLAFSIFFCSHAFHENCLEGGVANKCQNCSKLVIEHSSKKEDKGKKGGQKQQKEQEIESKSSKLLREAQQFDKESHQAGGKDQKSEEAKKAEKSQYIILKQLEFFDMAMQQRMLNKKNFN